MQIILGYLGLNRINRFSAFYSDFDCWEENLDQRGNKRMYPSLDIVKVNEINFK